MIKTYTSASDIDFSVDELPSLPRPGRVLMTKPTHFDVKYVINPHMADHVGEVDRQEAGRQWRVVKDAYESLGFTVNLVEGREDLEDMVFCANQTLPYYSPSDGEHGVVLGNMHAPQRREEVQHFERYFRSIGYDVLHISGDGVLDFEGMGDAIWHPRTHLLWGGYGIRTSREAYSQISEQLDVRVLLLRLEDEEFYHLDTCFSTLDKSSVLIFPGAFDEMGLGLIHHFFERVIEAPEDEARNLLACNCNCPDGERVIIQKGCDTTNRLLRDAGFEPMEVDTSEFLKAGGSVFCMKQMFW
jgi:N-dimethylarginine dimethylaminohydrolase